MVAAEFITLPASDVGEAPELFIHGVSGRTVTFSTRGVRDRTFVSVVAVFSTTTGRNRTGRGQVLITDDVSRSTLTLSNSGFGSNNRSVDVLASLRGGTETSPAYRSASVCERFTL